MAIWLVLVLVALLAAAAVAAVAVPARRRARRLADATDQREKVMLSQEAAEAATAAVALRAAAVREPFCLAAPTAPPAEAGGRHAIGNTGGVDTDTVRLHAVPVRRPVPAPHPERGHRAATPARPANAPTAEDSGPHRARRGQVATVAGAPLTAPR
jgi:hypothetical protein